MKSIVFRVDASRKIGTGHVMRCLALAKVLRERGNEVAFVCRELQGNMLKTLTDNGYPVFVLTPEIEDIPGTVLSVEAQKRDSAETLAALEGGHIDWIVVDHYGLDKVWEQELTARADQLLVIDDCANRKHVCDMLVDQNMSIDPTTKYQGLVADNCRQFIGPKYALINTEYARQRSSRQHCDKIQRVFVFFGGSDIDDLTGMTLDALLAVDEPGLKIDILVGQNYAHTQVLNKRVEHLDNVMIHGPRPHLADLMAAADLAIGAGGVTGWERMCSGLPAVVVTVAENQEPATQALASRDLVRYVGPVEQVTQEKLFVQIKKAFHDVNALTAQSERGMLEVDGLGTLRIAEQLDPTPQTELTLRKATAGDVHLYLNWANDTTVRKQAINTDAIAWPDHQRWFAARLEDDDCELLIMLAGNLPVGQIRFDREGAQTRISYSLDKDYRGRRWGSVLVVLGLQRFSEHQSTIFRAEVKSGNSPSVSVFERLGFCCTQDCEGSEIINYYLDSSRLSLASAGHA